MTMVRPRRSALYLPGSNARALEKAATLPADCLILDLEDAVAPEAKELARKQIAEAVGARAFGRREVLIRINATDTPYWRDDLAAAIAAAPDGILVPKVSAPGQLADLAERCGNGAPPLWAMIETPLAMLNLAAIAGWTHNRARLGGFVAGTNDLAREAGIALVPGRAPMLALLTQIVIAARAYGLAVLDGVFNTIGDEPGLAAECAQARAFGFDGKTLIHPNQIATCNAAFTPDAAGLARARKIVEAFDLPENAGNGALKVDGQMVEKLHAEIALRVIAAAEAANAAD